MKGLEALESEKLILTTVPCFEAVLWVSWVQPWLWVIPAIDIFTPKQTPKVIKKLFQTGSKIGAILGKLVVLIFGPILASFWQPFWGYKRAKRRQDKPRGGHQDPENTEKTSFTKSEIFMC